MTGSVSLDFAGAYEETTLESAPTLDRFLASVERRAFRIAQMAVRDRDEALDIVQGAMLRLARGYARRPSEEWKPLFYRILYNGNRDWQRRSAVRQGKCETGRGDGHRRRPARACRADDARLRRRAGGR